MLIKKAHNATIHGSGSIPFKWISGLNEQERNIVKRGGIVFCPYLPKHYKQSGFKIVVYRKGRYYHREPTARQLDKIIRHSLNSTII